MGLLGALGSFIALLLFSRRKQVIAFVLLAIIVAVTIFAVYQVHPLIYKLKLLGSVGQDHALVFRLSNWKDTIRIFLDFPWVGIGAGSFDELFPFYKTIPEKAIFSQVHFHYAENEFLQGLAEMGIIGSGLLGAFGFVLVVSFVKNWRQITSKTAMWLSLGMACGCVGMLTHSLVDFPTHIPSNMALFAVLGGMLLRFGASDPLFPPNETGGESQPLFSPPFFLRAACVILILFLIIPLLWRQRSSEHYYLKASEIISRLSKEREITPGPVLTAYEYLLKERKLGGEEESRIAFALSRVYTYLGLLRSGEARVSWFRQAEQALHRAVKRAPFNAAYHYALAWLYQEWGKVEAASPYLRNATYLEPQNPFYRFKFGKNQFALGKEQPAQILFKETIRINGAYVEPVLRFLTSSQREVTLDQLQVLLPEDARREEVKHYLAAFFDQRGDFQIAEGIRQFP